MRRTGPAGTGPRSALPQGSWTHPMLCIPHCNLAGTTTRSTESRCSCLHDHWTAPPMRRTGSADTGPQSDYQQGSWTHLMLCSHCCTTAGTTTLTPEMRRSCPHDHWMAPPMRHTGPPGTGPRSALPQGSWTYPMLCIPHCNLAGTTTLKPEMRCSCPHYHWTAAPMRRTGPAGTGPHSGFRECRWTHPMLCSHCCNLAGTTTLKPEMHRSCPHDH